VEFTPITESEFQNIRWRGPQGVASMELNKTIWDLELNTGFSTPCVWEHSTIQQIGPIKKDGTRSQVQQKRCAGIAATYTFNKKNSESRRVRCRCADGTLYVFRIA
jgi:hypothetical protein